MTTKIKTRILIISDTHGSNPKPEAATNFVFREPLPKADIAIHCGDLTMNGSLDQHEAAIALLESINAEVKVIIPGNHDLTLDTAYYEKHGHLYGPIPKYTHDQLQQIRNLYTGPKAQEAGIHYLEEGLLTLHLRNSASLTLYASAYTPEFCQWSFAYPLGTDRFNSPNAKNPLSTFDTALPTDKKNIDIIITHGPPYTILDRTLQGQNVGCPHLLNATFRSRPLLHCFGHIHEGWGAVRKMWVDTPDPNTQAETEEVIEPDEDTNLEQRSAYIDGSTLKRGKETLFVNAAIMNWRYRPVQAPWVVDLSLDPCHA